MINRLGALLTAALALSLALPGAGFASDGSHSGFVGNWTAIECATWWEGAPVDCGVWGDGSRLTLHIGHGDVPRVRYEDAYSSYCSFSGNRMTRWVGTGFGEYDGDTLWVNLTKTGCGAITGGLQVLGLYHDPGSDTLWEDEDGDGWGLIWHRSS